jgi:hypothetical protein
VIDRRALLGRAAAAGGLAAIGALHLPEPARQGCDWRSRLGQDLRPLTPIPAHAVARGRRGLAKGL